MSSLNTIGDMAILVQKHLSSLKRSCDLGSSEREKIIWTFNRTVFIANVMGIAGTVFEIIEHLFFPH